MRLEPVTVRRAGSDDAGAIGSLTDAAYGKYVPRLRRKPQPMMADYRQMIAEHAVWVLCLGEHPAGVLVLMAEPDALLIYSVAVAPAHQGRGLGRQLLALADWPAFFWQGRIAPRLRAARDSGHLPSDFVPRVEQLGARLPTFAAQSSRQPLTSSFGLIVSRRRSIPVSFSGAISGASPSGSP